MDAGSFTQVKDLSPSTSSDWVIKVRVVKKHEKREWQNERGSGMLMNVDLKDACGTMIQATFFKDAVERFE